MAMTEIRVEVNLAGIRELFRDEGVKAELNAAADEIARKANAEYGGDGFAALPAQDTRFGSIALVVADTIRAKYAEANHKTLSRAAVGR